MKITKTQLEKIIQEETESYVDSEARELARLFLDVIKGEGAPLSNFTKHEGLLLQTMEDMFMPDHSAAVVKKAYNNLKDGTVMETVQNQPYESKLTKSQLRQMIREEVQSLSEENLYDFRVRLKNPKTEEMSGKTERVDARDPAHAKKIVNKIQKEKGSGLVASSFVVNMDTVDDYD